MRRVGVRSEALAAMSGAAGAASDELGRHVRALLVAVARSRPPPVRGPSAWGSPEWLSLDGGAAGTAAGALLARWVGVELQAARALGPGGLAGEVLELEWLAARLQLAGRAYEAVEAGVGAVLRSVAAASDVAGRAGALTERGAAPVLRPVPATWSEGSFSGPADLVAAGQGLGGGRVRVVEVAGDEGRSAWVVVVPGTQEWSPVAGANPFDLTTDVRSVTREQGTVAAAGVVAALDRARAASGRSSPEDPVLLVGHSQGGILAAALACGPDVLNGHRVTHVLTTGAPVGLFPVPESVRVLSVEHADDPVPALDLTPNPSTPSWVTLRSGDGPPVVLRRHALDEYVRTMRGTVGGAAGADPATAAWEDSAEAFLGLPVRAVTEVVVTRGWQNPRP